MNIRNSLTLVGRLAKELVMTAPQTTASGKSYQKISGSLFVDRQGSDKADYVPFQVTVWSGADGQMKLGPWGFLHKGDLIALNGHLETWFSVDKAGNKNFGMTVVADDVDIALESKAVRETRRNSKS